MDDFFDFPAPGGSHDFDINNHEFDAFDLGQDVLYESPQRKKRACNTKIVERKSRKKITTQKNQAPTRKLFPPAKRKDQETDNWAVETLHHEAEALQLEADPWEFGHDSVEREVELLPARLLDRQENYLAFLDAVSADEDMLIRISREVFVVLGWTTEVTVCFQFDMYMKEEN